jgi:NAD(P)H dehydrogenase (quinone)
MITFTIAGGTGTVGKHLVDAFVQQGIQLRVLTRDAIAAASVTQSDKVTFVQVNFDKPETLTKGFEGTDRAFLCTGTSDRQVRDEIALIDAAVSANVTHLVNLSVGGAGGSNANNVLAWHTEIDAHLVTKNVAWTLLRPATYMDTVFRVAAGFIPHDLWGGTASDGFISLIDAEDVAAAAAAVLMEGPDRHRGAIYSLTGPDAVTMPSVALSLSHALHRQVKYVQRSREEQHAVYQSAGLPALMIDVLLGLDDLTRDNIFSKSTSDVFDLTGRAPNSVNNWIKKHISAFEAASA